MPTFTYDKTNPKLVKVLKDGVFVGYLTQEYRRAAPGMCRPSHMVWAGKIDGRDVHDSTLTNVKLKIEGKIDLVTGRVLV